MNELLIQILAGMAFALGSSIIAGMGAIGAFIWKARKDINRAHTAIRVIEKSLKDKGIS